MLETEVTELLSQNRRIAGVRIKTKDGTSDVRATLTIGADGRASRVRQAARLKVLDIGAPFDVLWLKLPTKPSDPHEPVGRFQGGQFFIMLYRGDYWQCAMIIPKGGFERLKAEGITGFRSRLRTVAAFARDRVDTIKSFDDVALLTVKIDRLEKWARAGLLCIGDAAHAMSPVGGVGINLAIQDAVAAANLLAPILRNGETPSLSQLLRVQKRRTFPTKATQFFQLQVQNRVLAPSFRNQVTPTPPRFLHILNRVSALRYFTARMIGVGVRPEHIAVKEWAPREAPALASA